MKTPFFFSGLVFAAILYVMVARVYGIDTSPSAFFYSWLLALCLVVANCGTQARIKSLNHTCTTVRGLWHEDSKKLHEARLKIAELTDQMHRDWLQNRVSPVQGMAAARSHSQGPRRDDGRVPKGPYGQGPKGGQEDHAPEVSVQVVSSRSDYRE